jgi:glycosyltransferase involved in cell wall biosynthesis
MTRLPVSVCLISGAEAHRIGRALASVSGWASEVLVVLNEEVNDGTDILCEEQGAKVFRERWKGYVAQKNSVADKAVGPWILSLDADEEVPASVGSDMGTGIPTGAFVCGEKGKPAGRADKFTKSSEWTVALAGCIMISCITRRKQLITRLPRP